jgi:bifunctional non-homologous end joining protein LigD
VPRPFEPMLLSPAKTIPTGVAWHHEPKIDGFRCSLQVEADRLRVWSRGGHEWSSKLPELAGLRDAGDGLVLDGELAVITADGKADFDLLSTRILRTSRPGDHRTLVNVYVFDVLRRDHIDLIDRPWEQRRAALEALDLARATGGRVQPVTTSTDGKALWDAVQALQGEGLCHKLASARYRPGTRSTSWRKTKTRVSAWFTVVGLRPPTPSKPAGLLLAENDDWLGGAAFVALPPPQRSMLAALLTKYGRRHPTGTITLPPDCIEAHVRYTSRTPTHGHLREATAVELRPTDRLH